MIIEGKQFLIGADIEGFLKNRRRSSIPAHPHIPGTKTDQFPLKDGMVQVDGLALEFGIRPAREKEEFSANINSVLNEIHERFIPKNLNLVFDSTATFTPRAIATQPPENLVLGCDPDYNAYNLKMNPRPNAPPKLRSAGGHIHIGWTTEPVNPLHPDHILDCAIISRLLDIYLGIPLLLLEKNMLRQSIYGRFGCFRPKPYGMEYRSPSSAWAAEPETINFVFEQVAEALQVAMNPTKFDPLFHSNVIARGDINYYGFPTPIGRIQGTMAIKKAPAIEWIKAAENISNGCLPPYQKPLTDMIAVLRRIKERREAAEVEKAAA